MKKQFDKNWLIFLVPINQELKIANQLLHDNIQCYVPTRCAMRCWGNKKQRTTKIIAPRMIFAYINETEQNKIMELPFKINYLLAEDKKPATIPQEHIQTLVRILNQENIPVEFSTKCPTYTIQSYIIRGVFKGLEGFFHVIDENPHISFPFTPLGYITIPIQPTVLSYL